MNMKRAYANYIAENIRLSKRNKEHEMTDYAGLVKTLYLLDMGGIAEHVETLVAKVAEQDDIIVQRNHMLTYAHEERDALQAKVAELEQMKPSMPTSSSVNLII